MVAPLGPRFGFVPEVNLSRQYLFRAHDALQAGNMFEAAVMLREAMRRQFAAECQWHDCLPLGFSDRTPPFVLLKTLHSAGHLDRGVFGWMKEVLQWANRACHAQPVRPSQLRSAIELMHSQIDTAPCGESFERSSLHPAPDLGLFGPADDDDDEWKAGVA